MTAPKSAYNMTFQTLILVLNAMAQAQFHGLREIANDYQKAARAEPPSYMEPMLESISRYSRPSVNREQFQA